SHRPLLPDWAGTGRCSMMPIARPRALLVATTVGAGTALVVFLAWIGTSLKPELLWPRVAFDSREWITAPPESRHKYVKDRLARKVLVGQTRHRVQEILGPPSSRYGERFATYTVAYPADYALTFDSVYFLRI